MIQYLACFYLLINFTTPNAYFNYHQVINEATHASYQKKYTKADSLFQEAVKLVETPFPKDYAFAVKNALDLKDFDKAFLYLKTGIQLGLSKEKIEKKSWFSIIQIREEWFLLEKEYPVLWQKYESQFETELRQITLEIYHRDQNFRLNGGKDFDKDNLERLKKIIAEKGYPSYHQIGRDIDLNLGFHHFSPEDNQKYFYKILKKAISTGDISPYEYGAIIDYDQIKKGELLIYGTYFKTIDGIRYLQPVQDFDAIDKRRKSIGLEPIEQFMTKFDIVYDPNLMKF